MSQTSPPQLTFEVSTPGRQPYSVTLRKSQNIVGRESGDIVLNDAETSALHAEIDTTAGHVVVRDLGSSNGTWRGGEQLPQFALYEGQSFYCGNTELRLVKIQGPGAGLQPGQTALGQTAAVDPVLTPRSPTIQGSPHADPSPLEPPPGWTAPASPPTPPSLGQPAPISAPAAPSTATLKGYAANTPAADGPPPQGPEKSLAPAKLSTPQPDLRASEVATAPPPSRGTLPGGNTPSSTATMGDAAKPAPASGGTIPGAATPAAPSVATPAAPSEPASPVAAQPARPQQPEPPAAPSTESPEPAAFRSAVANAVIPGPSGKKAKRASGAAPAPGAAKASKPSGPRRWPRLLVIGGLSALGVSALAGLAYLLWTLWAGRGVAFVEEVAEELPDTALGVLAIASPSDAVSLFGDDVPEGFRDQAKTHLSFDAEGWTSMGIEPAAPVGIALLAVNEPVMAIAAGVSDRDKLKATLEGQLAPFVAPSQDTLLWSERDYGDSPGLWLTEPPMALVYRDDRAILVFSPDNATAEEISRQAEAIAAASGDKSLAGGEGFDELAAPAGKTRAMLYADGSSIRGALPGGGFGVMAVRMALADLDAFALSLSTEGDTIHATSQVVVREGSRHLEMVEGQDRDLDALRRIGAPVLGSMDASFDGETIDRALGGVTSVVGGSLPVIEEEFREEVGLDLRGDITQNLAGDVGVALLRLPSEPRALDFGVVMWVGVADEDRARASGERLFAKLGAEAAEFGVTPLQVSDTLVYARPADEEDREPQMQAFITAGHLWVAIGEVDAAAIINGPDEPFLDAPRHKSIAKALGKGAHAAGFFDLKSGTEALRPLLSPRELEELEAVDPLLELLEVATMRSEVRGRTIVTQASVHTTEADGLAALTQAAVKRQGEQLTASLASAARGKRCAQLAEHVGGLSRVALKDAGAGLEVVWEIERKVLEECDGPTMTAARLSCYLETETIDGLSACDAKHPAGKPPSDPTPKDDPKPDPDTEEDPDPVPGAEPKKVPYVDDIWPHLGDDPDSENPQPEVNYAVPVGPDPDTRGPADALVTIIMFGDFQCPHCKAVVSTLDEVLAEHGDNVRLVFRHHPLEKIHPAARQAAKVALAAGEQDKFWEMHDVLFANQTRLGDADENEELFEAFASEVGLDAGQLKTDRSGVEIDRRLARDAEAAKKFGVQGTPAFFVNGRYLGGRQTRSAFNAIIGEERERAEKFVARRGGTRVRLYEDMISHFAPEVLQPTVGIEVPDADAKRYTLDTEGMPRKGATTFAQVQIIECGDFDCPYCARSRKALDEVLDAYPTQVALLFAHSPRDFHPGAEPAARAAVAAGEQDKFWEMHDELFKDQQADARSESDYLTYARRLGLDIDDFKRDMAASTTTELIASQKKLCEDNDGSATPTFFVNGRRVIGAKKFEQFKALVDAELAAGI